MANDRGLFVSYFPGSYLSTGLTQQQQQGLVTMTRGATGAVNNFITGPQPPLIEQKHTNNMEKHFLFLMWPCYHCHEGRISSLSVTGIEMINTVHSLMGNYTACLTGKWRTPRPWIFISFQGSSEGLNNDYLRSWLWLSVMTSQVFWLLMQRHTTLLKILNIN